MRRVERVRRACLLGVLRVLLAVLRRVRLLDRRERVARLCSSGRSLLRRCGCCYTGDWTPCVAGAGRRAILCRVLSA